MEHVRNRMENPETKTFLSLHPDIDRMVFTVNGVDVGELKRKDGKPYVSGRMVTEGKRVVQIEYNK